MRERDKKVSAHFRATLKTAMQAKGVKGYELARAAGVVATTISGYLHGKYVPSGTILMKLARALDMQPEELISGAGNPLHGKNGDEADAYVTGGRRALDEVLVALKELQKRWESQGARTALSSSDAVKRAGQALRVRRSKGS